MGLLLLVWTLTPTYALGWLGCTRRALARPMFPTMRSEALDGALVEEVKDYLTNVPQQELDDDRLPPPLSYTELSRRGREDLARAVMDGGGYIALSKALGVRWQMPKKVPDKPPLVPVENFDPTASEKSGFLKLGRARADTEDILSEKPLSAFKKENATAASPNLQPESKLASLLAPAVAPYVSDEDDTSLRQALVDMQLSGQQRAAALLLAWTLANAFGAGGDLVDPEIRQFLRPAALALIAVHVGSAGFAVLGAVQQGRNVVVWLAKGLLAGSSVIPELWSGDTLLPKRNASEPDDAQHGPDS